LPSFKPIQLFTLVFLPFAAGYFLSFLFRSINAVIAIDLVQDLALDASNLGLLTAAFFIAFALVQLPLGIVLDRFGAGRVQAFLLSLAALGSFLFSQADSILSLSLARMLIGIGCAGGLMAAFKAIIRWYPPERLALVNGFYLSIGGLGALAATQPVEFILTFTDWRGVFKILSVMTVIAAALVFFLVPRGDAAENPPPLSKQVKELGGILKDPTFWRLAPVSILGMGTTMAIQGLWAGPWLLDVALLGREAASYRLFAMAGAMAFGFIAVGYVADKLRARGIGSIHTITAGTILSLTALITILSKGSLTGWWHWIVFGAVGNVTALVYPALSRHFGNAFAGRANTANTMLVFGGTFAIQYAMGGIIDLWPRDATGSYPTVAYQTAFGAAAIAQVLSIIWLLLPSESVQRAIKNRI
jgi:MFS family permease